MGDNNEMRIWMTVAQLSLYLGLAPNTIYHKIHAKKNPIPYSKATGRVRFDLAKVNEWLDKGANSSKIKGTAQQQQRKFRLSDFESKGKNIERRTSART